MYGKGDQTRSFCYVDDLIEALVRFMRTEDECTGPMNLGNPQEFTIRELAETIIGLTGSKSEIICKPLPSDDPKQRQSDIGLARQKLNWEPKIAIEDGLKKNGQMIQQVMSVEIDVYGAVMRGELTLEPE